MLPMHSHNITGDSRNQLFLCDIPTSWSTELIAILLNKDLVASASAVQTAHHVYVERLPEDGVLRLSVVSQSERQRLLQAYQGLAIPMTHGYHFFSFACSWPAVKEEEGTTDQTSTDEDAKLIETPGPPLHLQLLALPTTQLQQRLQNTLSVSPPPLRLSPPSAHKIQRLWKHAALAKGLTQALTNLGSRPVIHVDGVYVSPVYTAPLLKALQTCTLWPLQTRKGVKSRRYLTVRNSQRKASPEHDFLWSLCQELWESVVSSDNDAHYTALALTYNMCGSPHVDLHDTTHQYVIALGDDFTGGALCVDNNDDHHHCSITKINVHNRLGRLDGRHVHWVDGWRGTERYSVVYYSTNEAHGTTPQSQTIFHNTWLQQKNIRM